MSTTLSLESASISQRQEARPAGPDGRPPDWKPALAAWAQPRLSRSLIDIATSVVPYLGLSVLMYFALSVSWLLTLALAVPAAGFAVRTFILFHDCTHGSFLPSRRGNAWLGAALGVVLHTPFAAWRHSHAIHHATSGDLDRRGGGDVWTLTVAEYDVLTPGQRLKYRLFRSPLVMFGAGPILAMIVSPRFVSWTARPRIRRSVIGTDLALMAIVGTLCWLIGWRDYLLVWGPAVWLAGAVGIWLFYVQHQFEDAYWQNNGGWDYADAALRGSSYLKLPKVLQFFTGNIGLHHVHHLNARIPNYNLQRAHDHNPVFGSVPTISLRDGMRAHRLKLWDERRGRLVSFADAAASVPDTDST
ncbi:MAG TPA: fatty acid desaturase [Solirubrobacteraceae bacterium]|nr:fatty acid desaturase [Solirubrobacteraceae bacterium]